MVSLRSILVVGLGYVGKVFAELLAQNIEIDRYKIFGYDIKPVEIDGVKMISHRDLTSRSYDYYFICLPTAYDRQNKQPILDDFWQVIKDVKPDKDSILIIESTVPVGTCDLVEKIKGCIVAHCPERVFPGPHEVNELTFNNRIIGCKDKQIFHELEEIYGSFVKGDIIWASLREAEISKLVENAYRDLNICFANEIQRICEIANVDFWKVRQLTNQHPRVDMLKAGAGVGGHCIAEDPYYLADIYNEEGELDKHLDRLDKHNNIINAVRELNNRRPNYWANKLFYEIEKFKSFVEKPKVLVCGTSYKQDIGDERNSPGLAIGKLLEESNYEVTYFDPYIPNKSILDISINFDAVVFTVPHVSFYRLQPRFIGVKKIKIIMDCCGATSRKVWEEAGFNVQGIPRA